MKNISYISALVFAAMLTACSNDSEESAYVSGSDAVRIDATVGSTIFTRSNPTGTAEEQTTFNSGDVITVSDGKSTASYTLGDDGSTWTSSNWLTWHSAPETFQAYYPGDVSGNSYATGTIQRDQSTATALASSDYMTCEKTEATIPSNRTLSLTMSRKAALVTISRIDYNDDLAACNPTISAITITSPSLAIPSDGTTAAITPYKDETAGKYYAIVAPSDAVSTETFISVTVSYTSSDNTPITKTYVITGIPAHKAGKSYTYVLALDKEKVTIGNVTVNEWTSGTITGGEAEVKPSYLDAKFKVGDSKYVQFTRGNLQYNIADKKYQLAQYQWTWLGTGTSPLYTITNDYITDTHNDGILDKFGWGTGDRPTYASTEASNYSAFVDWGTYAASDIEDLGSSVRTLTYDEWLYLFRNQYIATVTLTGAADYSGGKVLGMVIFPNETDETTAKGYLTNSKGDVAVYKLESDIVSQLSMSSTQYISVENLKISGALFLPKTAGYRNGTDKHISSNKRYYWSSSAKSETEAYVPMFSTTTLTPANYQFRNHGCNVRLVKDVEE